VVAEALVRRGEANAKKGDTLGAIASFTEVSLRFGLLNDTRMVEKDVAARAKSAELYTRIGEGGKAIPVLRKIITSFLFTENESVLRQVLGAFQSLSVAYYKSGEYGLGVQLSDEIVDGLSERSDAESPLTITDAYLKKATFLCLLNEDESALIALNSVFQRVGDSPDAAQIGFRARAYLLASTAYRHLGRKSEAATALCKAYAIRDHLDKGEMDQLNAEFVVQGLNRQGCPEKYR
jgi:tetratricopeptide (TPR) repeat protein